MTCHGLYRNLDELELKFSFTFNIRLHLMLYGGYFLITCTNEAEKGLGNGLPKETQPCSAGTTPWVCRRAALFPRGPRIPTCLPVFFSSGC